MRQRRSFAVVLTVVALACGVVSAPAGARAPSEIPVSGVITLVNNQTLSTDTLGAVTRIDAVAAVTFSGDVSGPAVEPYHALVLPNGTVLQRGTGSFSGAVDGSSGTLSYLFHGDATTGGVITIIGGTGDLSGAHGRVAYAPAGATTFDYEGMITLR
jgi:hypothetical protein